jgi:hypothetical protein
MKTLLLSRNFWAAVIGLGLIVLTAFVPNLPDLQRPLVELAGLVSAYILGSAMEAKPQPVEQVLSGLVRSRKFWATLVGLVVILIRAVDPNFPLSDDQISAIVLTLSAYTFGTGLQDGLSRQKEQIHA